ETILNTPGIDEDTRNQFITRTHMQAQRLTALLQDISILNRMDYAANVLTMERVDVSQLFADIVQETALAFESREMTLTNSLPQGIIVRGNPSLLYSIFRNLIDNALNYAGQGSIVKVYAAVFDVLLHDGGEELVIPHLFGGDIADGPFRGILDLNCRGLGRFRRNRGDLGRLRRNSGDLGRLRGLDRPCILPGGLTAAGHSHRSQRQCKQDSCRGGYMLFRKYAF
ncbi:MAG: hypothetical protein J6P98_01735, partial [Clostridia bacterium]|nr:hypothetical protein [Clostridia bacterium]